MIKQKRLFAQSALIFACLFWGISFSASKTALNFIPPLTVVFLRLFISLICFLIWVMIFRVKFHFNWNLKWMGRIFILSLFGAGVHYSTQTIGIKYTTASNASVFPAMAPVLILLISVLFLKEKINLQKIIGIVISLAGVVLVIGPEVFLQFELKGHLLGDFLVFLSILMWAIFTVISKSTVSKMSALEFTTIITFIGTLYMLPLSLMEMKAEKTFSLLNIPPVAWLSVAFLGVTCSFIATLLYVFSLKIISPYIAGMYLYTIPVIGCIFAAIFLNEIISFAMIIGIFLVISGVYFSQKQKHKN